MPASSAQLWDRNRRAAAGKGRSNVSTHLSKTVSPCRTVMLSITLLSDWESPWLRTGNPAGTRSKILRERRTVHLEKTTKYPRRNIVFSLKKCRDKKGGYPTVRQRAGLRPVSGPVEIIYPQFVSLNPNLLAGLPRCAGEDKTLNPIWLHCKTSTRLLCLNKEKKIMTASLCRSGGNCCCYSISLPSCCCCCFFKDEIKNNVC